ncbi:MAG TPA: hypothetical protein VEA60_15150 [Allosphingosinicella sp.]|nr:hypothetical protein [Allosphingosinicella sp.]
MDFLADSVSGLVFVAGGAAAALATSRERYRSAERVAACVALVFMALPVAGLDAAVPWAGFTELCVAVGILLFLAALVIYARSELAEGEYD